MHLVNRFAGALLALFFVALYAWPQQCLDVIEVQKLTASDGEAGDFFGLSAAIAGGVAIFGANWDDHSRLQNAGSAYVFERDSLGAWSEVAMLTASDPGAGDLFGLSVSLSGDTAVAGSRRSDNEVGEPTGAAYVFDRNAGGADAWGQVRKLLANDGEAGDAFGYSVSKSGDTIVVSAPDHGGNFVGAVYVFERSQGGENAWGQTAKLLPSDSSTSDWFGESVSVSGNTIVVGAPWADASGTNSGAVYVFERDAGGAWEEVTKLVVPSLGFGDEDEFGSSVAIAGDTIVAGAPMDDYRKTNDGSAYIFERDQGGAGSWGQLKMLNLGNPQIEDKFGTSVAIYGDEIVIGAIKSGSRPGNAHLFERNNGGANAWGKIAKISASDATGHDEFGNSVGVWEDSIVVGAWRDNASTGAGYAYEITRSPSTVATRPGGANPSSYVATPGVFGGVLSGACDLSTTGHSMASFFAFESATQVTLGGGQTLLCQDLGSGEMLTGVGLGPLAGPMATFNVPVPLDTSLCGTTLYSQAVHIGGVVPFALSNAQDIQLGF